MRLIESRAALGIQLMEITHRYGRHVVPVDSDVRVLTGGGPRTPAQVRWFLDHERWEEHDDLLTECGTDRCINHLSCRRTRDDDRTVVSVTTPEDVVTHAIQRDARRSLASLFRDAKRKGLVSTFRAYQ